MGAGTTVRIRDLARATSTNELQEILACEIFGGHIEPLRESVGCTGGIAGAENQLRYEAWKLDPSTSFRKDTIDCLYHLRGDSPGFVRDNKTHFTGDFMRNLLCQEFKEPFDLLVEEVQATERLKTVVICSVSVSSNPFLRQTVTEKLEKLVPVNNKPTFNLIILDPVVAKYVSAAQQFDLH